MRYDAQFDTGSLCELGVQSKYFDRKGYLVDNALAGTVPTAEKFQVFYAVIKAITVYVMYGFFGVQFALKLFLHHVAMLKNFVGWRTVLRRDSKHGVLSFYTLSDLRQSVPFAVNLAGPFVLALLAAQGLLVIDGSTTLQASFVEGFAAVFAIGFVTLVGIFAASFIGARHGAVFGVFSEFFSVRFQVRRLHGKWLAAFLARKFNWRDSRGSSSVNCFVRSNASFAAKAARSLRGLNSKRLVAMLAVLVDGHALVPNVGNGSLVK